MSLHTLLAQFPPAFTRTARHSRATVLRVLHRCLAQRPVLAPAGAVADGVPFSGTIHAAVVWWRIRWRHTPRWLRRALVAVLVLVVGAHEVRTSALQSWFFSYWASRLTYSLGSGPSPQVVFPRGGPLDQRLGYTRIPEFKRRLETQAYRVTAQTQFSDAAASMAAWGILPPYHNPALPGLVIRGVGGLPLYDGTGGRGIFRTLDEVPPLLLKTLLFIENRRLQDPSDPRENPVVDWPRLVKAGALYAGRKLGLPLPPEGGSTLATQLEKFAHSPHGRTSSPLEKLRQITPASLKAYREGGDTGLARQEILLRYLNEVPLTAAPGWGEVNGLGDGIVAWFGVRPDEVLRALASPSAGPGKARAYKQVLTLLCAIRGPTYYLVRNRAALEDRVRLYTTLLERAGVIDEALARRVRETPVVLRHRSAAPPARLILERKAMNHLRVRVGQLLGEPNLYLLDRLHLEVDSTLDAGLQRDVASLFDQLRDRGFLARHGLIGEHLLGGGDPRNVVYSFLLLERTPLGNVVRVQTDTLDGPFDVNAGTKMELGSTAKLRTLAHYLELMTTLYGEFSTLDASALAGSARAARDPLTRWAAKTLQDRPGLTLEAFLQLALDRRYSASPAEVFFTSGGAHAFANYDRDEDGRVYSVRHGLIQSVNLVYIRLMRDIVRFHEARLPYDAATVLSDPDDPVRRGLLAEIAEAEGAGVLGEAYRAFRNLSPGEVEARLLGRHGKDIRRLAMLFFAWHAGAGEEALGPWLASRVGRVSPEQVRALARAYGNPRLTLGDFGFLLGRHPLEVWCAGQLASAPGMSWKELLARSHEPIRLASAWLLKTRNPQAQDLRLRTRMEQDAFARMTPSWRRLGFPFDHLVPSLATAIGSSADRPDALAELMGTILNDGLRLPTIPVQRLRFAAGTPYETVLERVPEAPERVMPVAVARVLRQVLAGVVTEGTARRLAGAFSDTEGTAMAVGGKTGSGDNRFKTFSRGGGVTSSRPVSRTATFAFYLGDRYVGVITASVAGAETGKYHFSSPLPVAVLRLLAPAMQAHLNPSLPWAEDPLARLSPSASVSPHGTRGEEGRSRNPES